jgi:hypothetical protein
VCMDARGEIAWWRGSEEKKEGSVRETVRFIVARGVEARNPIHDVHKNGRLHQDQRNIRNKADHTNTRTHTYAQIHNSMLSALKLQKHMRLDTLRVERAHGIKRCERL